MKAAKSRRLKKPLGLRTMVTWLYVTHGQQCCRSTGKSIIMLKKLREISWLEWTNKWTRDLSVISWLCYPLDHNNGPDQGAKAFSGQMWNCLPPQLGAGPMEPSRAFASDPFSREPESKTRQGWVKSLTRPGSVAAACQPSRGLSPKLDEHALTTV